MNLPVLENGRSRDSPPEPQSRLRLEPPEAARFEPDPRVSDVRSTVLVHGFLARMARKEKQLVTAQPFRTKPLAEVGDVL